MCQCRPIGFDGPDYSGCEFDHHRQRAEVERPSIMDSKWIFHVSSTDLIELEYPSNYSTFRTSTVGQLLYGRLSDIWSRKVILLIGLAIFFIGSLASSLAQSVTQLIIFRCFTGIGGGGLMTVAQLIVSDVVPLRERGKYQGILVSWPRSVN